MHIRVSRWVESKGGGLSLLHHEYIGFQAARGLTPIDKGHLFRYVTPDVGKGLPLRREGREFAF